MYIYLRYVSDRGGQNFTSKTLFYLNGVRIWKPTFESPYIVNYNVLSNSHGGKIQLKKLKTSQKRSKHSGSRENFSVRKYRGICDPNDIKKFGFYRYRLVKNGKKTQWRTISIMFTGIRGYYIK